MSIKAGYNHISEDIEATEIDGIPVASRTAKAWERGVFFVQELGPLRAVKIGWSHDVEPRLANIRTACPYELAVIGVIPDACAAELRVIVKTFEHLRMRDKANWFRPSQELLDYISENAITPS